MSLVSAMAAVIGVDVDRARSVPLPSRRSFIAGKPLAYLGVSLPYPSKSLARGVSGNSPHPNGVSYRAMGGGDSAVLVPRRFPTFPPGR
jgi:hypothetical protein